MLLLLLLFCQLARWLIEWNETFGTVWAQPSNVTLTKILEPIWATAQLYCLTQLSPKEKENVSGRQLHACQYQKHNGYYCWVVATGYLLLKLAVSYFCVTWKEWKEGKDNERLYLNLQLVTSYHISLNWQLSLRKCFFLLLSSVSLLMLPLLHLIFGEVMILLHIRISWFRIFFWMFKN